MKTKRLSKRQLIYNFFRPSLGTIFPSQEMHEAFGTAFRSRVSEINRGDYDIMIFNETDPTTDASVYWAALKA